MNMKINSENYGQFIVDYYDGQLSPAEVRLLLHFLEKHPELKEVFDRFADMPVLEKETVAFPEKAALKQPEIKPVGTINEENYAEYFVLAQDGELPEKVQRQLQLFLAENPFLKGEYERFALARLSLDENIVFENKAQLKKRVVAFWLPYATGVAAAVLLLFFGLRFLFPVTGNREIAHQALAVHPLMEKTVRMALAGGTAYKVKMKTVPVQPKNSRPVLQNEKQKLTKVSLMPMQRSKPVKLLASATIYPEINRQIDYFPLLFPKTFVQQEYLARSLPVVVEKPVHHNFLRHTIGKSFSQLAAVLALQKRKNKMSGVHDKGFVKILQKGVVAVNALTDNDVLMVKTYDAKGRLIDYQLLSDNFSINRPVKESR